LPSEKIVLTFLSEYGEVTFNWNIRKGIRGARDANKVRKLQKQFGDPIKIEGNGVIANLLRREYTLYNQDRVNYKGVPTKDILKAGAQITGLPVEKIQKLSNKLRKKVERKKKTTP